MPRDKGKHKAKGDGQNRSRDTHRGGSGTGRDQNVQSPVQPTTSTSGSSQNWNVQYSNTPGAQVQYSQYSQYSQYPAQPPASPGHLQYPNVQYPTQPATSGPLRAPAPDPNACLVGNPLAADTAEGEYVPDFSQVDPFIRVRGNRGQDIIVDARKFRHENQCRVKDCNIPAYLNRVGRVYCIGHNGQMDTVGRRKVLRRMKAIWKECLDCQQPTAVDRSETRCEDCQEYQRSRHERNRALMLNAGQQPAETMTEASRLSAQTFWRVALNDTPLDTQAEAGGNREEAYPEAAPASGPSAGWGEEGR